MFKKYYPILSCLYIFFAVPTAVAADQINIKYFKVPGGRLAFAYETAGSSDIYVIDFAALKVRSFVASEAADTTPSWSPDGQTLAFSSNRSGDFEIYTVDASGTDLQQLTTSPGRDDEPSWSPDGKKILFRTARSGSGTEIYQMQVDGSEQQPVGLRRKSLNSKQKDARWSPRGTEIVYVSNEDWPGWDISLYDLNAATTKLLTKGYQSFSQPAWHPDGGSFAFSYSTGGSSKIWEFVKGEKSLRKTINRAGNNYDPEWTEDGKMLFFAGEEVKTKKKFQLFLWHASEKAIYQVTEAPGSIRYPSWNLLPAKSTIEKSLEQSQ